MRVEEVAQELGISKSHAYKVIHKLNAELREKGYLTISGGSTETFSWRSFAMARRERRANHGSLQGRKDQHLAGGLPLY